MVPDQDPNITVKDDAGKGVANGGEESRGRVKS